MHLQGTRERGGVKDVSAFQNTDQHRLDAHTPTVSLSANLSLRTRESDLIDLESSLEMRVSF